MSEMARTRAEVDIRSGPKAGAGILDRLPTDCSVEILADLNRWYKVKPGRILNSVSGFLPQMALTFPVAKHLPVFPDLPFIANILNKTSVPASVKLVDFLGWLTTGGKPSWITQDDWSKLNTTQQADLLEKIRLASQKVRPRWDDWIAGLKTNNRIGDAVLKEWIVIMEGGRELYALRDHYVYMNPVQDANYYGYVARGQIMRWTGHVRSNTKDGKRKDFYEVDFFRLSRYMHGWFRADVTADYVYPTANTDPSLESNALTVFDLSKSILRMPQDQAMADSKKKGYYAAQYIDVFGATNKHLVHFSLCGEFCVAAIGGVDVLPLLKKWLESKYLRAPAILADPHEGTSAGDLQTLLKVIGLNSEIASSTPNTPQAIKERLNAGQFMIASCGINSTGRIKANGKIRHWVVIEDVIASGTSGWVRVYNPFQNRDEVYNFSMFLTSGGAGVGLWVLPPDKSKQGTHS